MKLPTNSNLVVFKTYLNIFFCQKMKNGKILFIAYWANFIGHYLISACYYV